MLVSLGCLLSSQMWVWCHVWMGCLGSSHTLFVPPHSLFAPMLSFCNIRVEHHQSLIAGNRMLGWRGKHATMPFCCNNVHAQGISCGLPPSPQEKCPALCASARMCKNRARKQPVFCCSAFWNLTPCFVCAECLRLASSVKICRIYPPIFQGMLWNTWNQRGHHCVELPEAIYQKRVDVPRPNFVSVKKAS